MYASTAVVTGSKLIILAAHTASASTAHTALLNQVSTHGSLVLTTQYHLV